MGLFRISPDLAVSKTDSHTFNATFTTSSGTPTIDYGDGTTETSLTPSHAYSTGNPFLINITSDPKLITGITIENESVTAIGLDRFINATSIDLRNNSLSLRQVEKILDIVNRNGQNSGSLQLDGNTTSGLSAEGIANGQAIVARGWTVSGFDWTPSQVTTQLWLDASDSSTISHSAGAVSQWRDKSGNTRHASQNTGANQPITGTRTINSLNALDFDGSNDFFDWNHSFNLIGDNIFAIAQKDDNGSSNHMMGAGGNVQIAIGDGSNGMRLWQSSNPFSGDTRGSISSTANTHLYGWFADTDFKRYDFNGTVTTTSDAYDADPSTMIPTFIGKGQFGQHVDGMVAEIVIVATASTDTRQKIEGYLAHKWGIEANLPGGHPYKTTAPTVFD